MKRSLFLVMSLIAVLSFSENANASGTIKARQIDSENFSNNKIGVNSVRKFQVYLPEGYEQSSKRYPVLYLLHSFFENETALFGQKNVHAIFEKAMREGGMHETILVTADFNTTVGGSLYTNSSVTGQWRDFMVNELVPHIDNSFRTLAARESRGICGYHAGAYGAIRFASRHPEIFGSVYGLHPVATGFGHTLMQSRPDLNKLKNLESLDEIQDDFLSKIFSAIYQANLPNPNKPPLFFDAPATETDGVLNIDSALTDKLQEGFFLERQVGTYADNLKSLIGFKFDWGRHDGNQDHVYSNQFYSRKLNEYGIPHEAEEYNGGWGDKTFEAGGRIETDVIPFFQKHLTAEEKS